jgi:hypothetical protein
MPDEIPRFIHGIAGARPSHQRLSPRPPNVEMPTWAAYLMIVLTREHEPDRGLSGKGNGCGGAFDGSAGLAGEDRPGRAS